MKLQGKIYGANGWEAYEHVLSERVAKNILELSQTYQSQDTERSETPAQHLLRAAQAIYGKTAVPGAATHGNRTVESVEQGSFI